LHILDVDLKRPKIRGRKSSGKLHLRTENGGSVDPTMQHLSLGIAANIQCFGKKICVRNGGLFHFAPLHLSVRRGHFLHCFKFVLIRNSEHRTNHALLFTPR